jgi:hypothetical protein
MRNFRVLKTNESFAKKTNESCPYQEVPKRKHWKIEFFKKYYNTLLIIQKIIMQKYNTIFVVY